MNIEYREKSEKRNLEDINIKEQNLKEYLRKLKSVAVAFSSGVDSTYLLKIAKDTLGIVNVLALTINSNVVPNREILEAEEFCKSENIKHVVIPFNELEIEGFAENPMNRCYICKKALFTKLKEVADEYKMNELIEGSNMDDESDYRPGMKAITELDIKSPLRKANLYKNEIRELSKKLKLPTWNKPSFACLASRFVYGEEITSKKLKMVEQGEDYLLSLGLNQFRVRIHGEDLARIEVEPNDIEIFLKENVREKITKKFKDIGFNYITIDIQGYRTGSMNERILNKEE